MAKEKPVAERVRREGIKGAHIGEHPLTIWLLVSAIVIFLYIRRSRIGIDLHPSEEKKTAQKPMPAPKPKVEVPIPPLGGRFLRVPVLSPGYTGGPDWSK